MAYVDLPHLEVFPGTTEQATLRFWAALKSWWEAYCDSNLLMPLPSPGWCCRQWGTSGPHRPGAPP